MKGITDLVAPLVHALEEEAPRLLVLGASGGAVHDPECALPLICNGLTMDMSQPPKNERQKSVLQRDVRGQILVGINNGWADRLSVPPLYLARQDRQDRAGRLHVWSDEQVKAEALRERQALKEVLEVLVVAELVHVFFSAARRRMVSSSAGIARTAG